MPDVFAHLVGGRAGLAACSPSLVAGCVRTYYEQLSLASPCARGQQRKGIRALRAARPLLASMPARSGQMVSLLSCCALQSEEIKFKQEAKTRLVVDLALRAADQGAFYSAFLTAGCVRQCSAVLTAGCGIQCYCCSNSTARNHYVLRLAGAAGQRAGWQQGSALRRCMPQPRSLPLPTDPNCPFAAIHPLQKRPSRRPMRCGGVSTLWCPSAPTRGGRRSQRRVMKR